MVLNPTVHFEFSDLVSFYEQETNEIIEAGAMVCISASAKGNQLGIE